MINRGGAALDPERGRRLARQLGADLYVLGDDRRHREPGPDRRPPCTTAPVRSRSPESSVEGEAGRSSIWSAGSRPISSPAATATRQRLSRVAATTTRSLPAFKAYLDGERAYDRGARRRGNRGVPASPGHRQHLRAGLLPVERCGRPGRPSRSGPERGRAGAAFPGTAGRAGATADRGAARLAHGPGGEAERLCPRPGGRLPGRRRGVASAGRGAGARQPAPGTLIGRGAAGAASRCSPAIPGTVRR